MAELASNPYCTNPSDNVEKPERLLGNDLSTITDKKQKTIADIPVLSDSYYGTNRNRLFPGGNTTINGPEAFSSFWPGVLYSVANRFLDYGNQIHYEVGMKNLDVVKGDADSVDELFNQLDHLMHLKTMQCTALLTLRIPDYLNPHPFGNLEVIRVDSLLLIDRKLDSSITAKCGDMMKAITPLQPGPLVQLRFINPLVQPQPKKSVQLQLSGSHNAQSLTHEFENTPLQSKSNLPEQHLGEQGAPSGMNSLSIPNVDSVCDCGLDLIPASFFHESGIMLTVYNCEPKPEFSLTKASSYTPNMAIKHFLNTYGDQPQLLVEGPPRANQQEGELLPASSTSKMPVKDKRWTGRKVVINRSTRRDKEDEEPPLGASLSSWKKYKNGAPVKTPLSSRKKIEKIPVQKHFDDHVRPGEPGGQKAKAMIISRPTNRCAATAKDASTSSSTSTSLKPKGKATKVLYPPICGDTRDSSQSMQLSVKIRNVTHTSTDLSVREQGECSDFSSINPQEEAQYGLQSSMEFSKESSLMKLLKACNQKGINPVICLVGRDVPTDKLFSNEHRSVSPYTYRLGNLGEGSGGNPTVVGDSMRGPSARDAPSSSFEQHKGTADLVHASHYSEIVERLGEAKDLPSLFIVGVAYFKMSKFAEARWYFNKARTAAFKEHSHGDIMLCNAYLGDIEYTSQSFLSAAEYYKEAINFYAVGTVASIFKLTPPTVSAIHAKRASSFRNVSKMVEAVHEYRNALKVAETDRDKLSAHTSLGNLYQSMGENTSALKEYKESIELAEKLSDQVSLGWAHGNIGNAYLGLGKKDEAISHLQKSLDLAAEYEQTPQAIGRTYNNLGTAYQSMNDLDKAEEYYDLALSQAIYGNDIAGQARVYGNIGNVHMLRKNYERAIPHYSEVLRLSKDPSTVSTAQHNRGCAYYEWATFYHPPAISHSHFHGPDCDKDSCLSHMPARAKDLYEKGSADLEEVVKHHEERFQHIKGSSQGLTLSVSLFESNSRTFHRLQDCLVCLHRWEQALVVAEQSRARTLGELMLKKKGIQHLTSPLTFDQIASIVSKQSSPLVYLSYTGARLIGWVFTHCRGKVSMSTFEAPLTDDQFEGKSFDYHLRYSLTEELVERSFELYQSILYDSDSSSPVQRLHELIAAPIIKLLHKDENLVSQTREVVFILDSYTTLLPLTCLLDQSGSFFGDKYYFKLVPSLLAFGIMGNLLEVQVTLQTDKYDFCVIGDPNIPPFFLNGEVWTLGKLPYARREAEWVAFSLHTTPILNENATKTALLNRAMSAKLIHIATHGSASAGFLAFSCFVISSQSGSTKYAPPENVLLYPKEIEDIHISPALVVLSSCDSGRGTVKADGIQGMARAFILAGAQSVLTTLWKVPDESASVFMQFFYQYLMDGIKSSLALHKATLSVRCFAKYSQYIHWSGYQLTGRDVQFSRKESNLVAMLSERLGPSSSFPFLSILKKLEKSLVNNPNLPTDVQIVKGVPSVEPSDVVIDFISAFHQSFSAGIFWINCSQSTMLTATINCIETMLGFDILQLPTSENQQALFILDGAFSLPESESLLRLLKSQHVHIIFIYKSYTPIDKLIKEVDRKLIRGCVIYNVEPLSVIHSTKRIVYSIMKTYDFTPTNDDQQVFERLAEFTTGSPLLVEIATKVVDACFQVKKDPVQQLTKLLMLEVTAHVKMSELMVPSGQASTRTISEKIMHKLVSADIQFENAHNICATHTPYDFWDSVVLLIDACNLTSEQKLLLNCLSVFGCSPVPFLLVTELASLIAKSSQKPHLAGNLHHKLVDCKLLKKYPQPIVLHPSVVQSSNPNMNFVYVPQELSHCIWNVSEDVDKVCILNLTYIALNRLLKLPNDTITVYFLRGVCSLLFEIFELNFTLIGKECFQAMCNLSLSF